MKVWKLFLIAWILPGFHSGFGKSPAFNPFIRPEPDTAEPEKRSPRQSMTHDLDYSLAFSGRIARNWKHDDGRDQIILLQDLKCRISTAGKQRITWSHRFEHQIGIQYFIDSITQIQTDENTLDSRLEISIGESWNISFLSVLSTPFFNSLFLTPLRWTFSAGLGFKWKNFGSINLGLTGGQLTYVRNTGIYDKLGVTCFFGVPKGEKTILEYGLSLQVSIERNLWDKLGWNANILIFKNKETPVDISFKNSFSMQLGRFIRAGIQTRLFYERLVSPKLQIENLVSAGFSFVL